MELVNHPQHYNQPGKRECIEQMRIDYGDDFVAIFCLTNAYKYLYRAGAKQGNSLEQDINKASWYYNYMMEKLSDTLHDAKILKLASEIKEGLKKAWEAN